MSAACISHRARVCCAAALGLLLLTGCSETVESQYGVQGYGSVNGPDVLADLFTQANHRVRIVQRRLTPKIRDKADVIVWFPDKFELPNAEEQAWFDTWLTDKPGRTLIYVGRDFDAEPLFWEKILEGAPADKAAELERRLNEARSRVAGARGVQTDQDSAWGWFRGSGLPKIRAQSNSATPATQKPDGQKLEPRQLTGDPAWIAGVNAAMLEVGVHTALDPVFEADVLLSLEGECLLSRRRIPAGPAGPTGSLRVDSDVGFGSAAQSQLFVAVNSSFLGNMPLVNKEHRKIAARLVADVGQNKQVYFLESDHRGLQLPDERTPEEEGPELGWPPPRLQATFLHLGALAIILIVSRWPIFGRPREERSQHETDFGRHVEALGDLLARGGNAVYAQGRLAHYRQTQTAEKK